MLPTGVRETLRRRVTSGSTKSPGPTSPSLLISVNNILQRNLEARASGIVSQARTTDVRIARSAWYCKTGGHVIRRIIAQRHHTYFRCSYVYQRGRLESNGGARPQRAKAHTTLPQGRATLVMCEISLRTRLEWSCGRALGIVSGENQSMGRSCGSISGGSPSSTSKMSSKKCQQLIQGC